MVTEKNINTVRSGWKEYFFGRSGATDYVAKKINCSKQTVLNALRDDKPISKVTATEIKVLEEVEKLIASVKLCPGAIYTALKEHEYD